MPDPDRSPEVSRRRALAVLATALLGPAAVACSSQPPPPDPLEAELEAARGDSDLAAAAAKAAPREVAPALAVVADERARHATALVEELARAAGKPTPTSTAVSVPPTTAAAVTTAPPPPPPTPADVMAALRRSAASAAALVPTLSGYRAGLMGSIAAACTTSYTVGLSPVRRPA